MTTEVDPSPRTRRARRTLASSLALAAIVAGPACATESEDGGGTDVEAGGGAREFAATAAYLRQAAEQSTAEGYRLEMRISLTGEVDEQGPPFVTGEVDGDRQHLVMDMASMMTQAFDLSSGSLPPEMADMDWTMEMVQDPDAVYLRAPMFAQMGDLAGAAGPFAAFAEMGDGWGYVDLSALGDQVPSDIAASLGGQGVDPRKVVEAIEGSESVEDLGTDEVRGAAVHGLSADVTLADLLEASGQDPDALAQVAGVGDANEAIAEAMYEATVPVSVWIDDDGYVRRMAYGWNMAEVGDAMGQDGAAIPSEVASMQMNFVMDMFDYGTTVEFEAPADAVDVTEAFAAILGT